MARRVVAEPALSALLRTFVFSDIIESNRSYSYINMADKSHVARCLEIVSVVDLADCWTPDHKGLRDECAINLGAEFVARTNIRSHTVTAADRLGVRSTYDTTLVTFAGARMRVDYPWVTSDQVYVERHVRSGLFPHVLIPSTTYHYETDPDGHYDYTQTEFTVDKFATAVRSAESPDVTLWH
jgi:hypothetical protein